jgi:hypothetical protein
MDITFERSAGTREVGGLLRKGALSLMVVGLLGPLALHGTFAAFDTTPGARTEGFGAGTVYLTSDGGGSLFRMPNRGPGSTAISYATISYQGTLPVTVRLYGSTSGTGLARFLTLTITRGTGEGRRFVPDPIDYVDAGPGVVYRGTLAAFPEDYARGIEDPETWEESESHSYRFEAMIADDPRIEGLDADASFSWEARNT